MWYGRTTYTVGTIAILSKSVQTTSKRSVELLLLVRHVVGDNGSECCLTGSERGLRGTEV